MPAATTDLFSLASSGTAPLTTTLTASRAIGGPSFSVTGATGWATTTLYHFKVYTSTTTNGITTVTPGTETLWSGIVSGLTLGSLTLRSGPDQVYPINAIVEPMLTSAQYDNLITGLLIQHAQNGSHTTVTATTLSASGAISSGSTISATGSLTGSDLTTTGNIVVGGTSRVTAVTVVSAATIAPTSQIYDVTALAVGLTINVPAFTAVNGMSTVIRIKDNGTAQALTFAVGFVDVSGIGLPTATIATKLLTIGAMYNTASAKWEVQGINQQA